MPIHVSIAYNCFCAAMAELSSCDRDHTAYEAWNIQYQALSRKTLPTPELDNLNVNPIACRSIES